MTTTDTAAAPGVEEPQAAPDVLGEADAAARLAASTPGAVVAAAGRDPETGLPTRWHAYLVPEGLRTTDHRLFRVGSGIWRALPLALEWNREGNDHSKAVLVGKVETVERDDQGRLYSTGPFDLATEEGREAARLCDEEMLRWVSPVYELLASELVEFGVGGGSGDPFLDDLFGIGGGDDYDWYEEITSYRIMSVTMVTHPAFPQSVVAPEDKPLPEVEPMGEAPTVSPGVVAAAHAAGVDLLAPPAYFFEDPVVPCPTPTVVTNEGRVLGHLALWGVEHTAFPNTKIFAPRSRSGYAYATTGPARRTAEGTDVKVGHITLGTGHADLGFGYHETARHYDDTGTCVADVVWGEDQFGIWFSGALRPGVTPEQILVLRASALSGDWREIGGGLELVAALCVNVPGFPIVASGLVAAAEILAGPRVAYRHADEEKVPTALVAAGIVTHDPARSLALRLVALESQVASLRQAVEPALAASVEALRARLPQ